MSGRSAYVRKKITETNKAAAEKSNSARTKSVSSRGSERDDVTINEYQGPQGTGYGTTNARFLKFSEPIREAEIVNYRQEITNFSNNSSGSQSGGSDSGMGIGRRNVETPSSSVRYGPMPEFAYGRARKPVLKTEDVSGIERSGLRSALDKKSDGVRKGLSKAFSFGKKKKDVTNFDLRPPSEATVRPATDSTEQFDFTDPATPPMPAMSPQGVPWDGDNGSGMMPPPPSAKLPPLPPSATPVIKRWIGAGRPVQRWNKLRKDPELWDPNGDVLVYFGHKGQSPRVNPSFRLSSHIIEATESRFLVTLLREGSTEEDIMQMPPSPVGAPPMLRSHIYGNSGQPTPPISEDNSLGDADGQISYEMYFPTPPNVTKTDAHRYAITTRNVFALLYHASLVGLSLFQALSDLHLRLEEYMPPEADNVGTILNYLSARGIDDCRNDPETAVSLLAWCESVEVRWEEGWREAFLHAAGMFSRLENCADFKSVTPITRALLERACLETQLRVQAAEERLDDFSYGDIWPSSGVVANSPARAAADRLQKFFVNHYNKTYGKWPPPIASGAKTSEGDDMWLTRTLAFEIQKDFGALYDYLVNRDIVWDESETRSSRKWMMVSESGNRTFEADTDDLPITDMLIEFDNRLRYPHIPHPYPLVPDSIPPVSASSSREKLRKDKSRDRDGNGNGNKGADDRILERRVQLAYTEATNIYILGSDFMHTDLIDSFVKFEKADHIGAVDPSAARRGRWVLVYCILQTLASVSVDSPNVRYRDDVAYHLSPRLKGTKTPPWKGVMSPALEASHELSHCWVAPRTWTNGDQSANESDASVTSGGAGGGHSPVMRMMRAQANQFPRPPPTNRSSTAGWHTPGTRSVRSSGTGPPPPMSNWGGSSSYAMSVSGRSDDSSIRTPSSAHPSLRTRSRDGNKSVRSYATFGRVNEEAGDGDYDDEAAAARASMMTTGTTAPSEAGSTRGAWPTRKQSMRTSRQPPPLPLTINSGSPPYAMPGTALGGGDGDSPPPLLEGRDSDRPRIRRKGSKPILGGGGGDGLGPVIKDFDVLDVVDDHDP